MRNTREIVDFANSSKYKAPKVKYDGLPQHEFSWIIIAPKGSGKTLTICNMLMNHYKGYFNKVIVCSPTLNNDEKWDFIRESKGILTENPNTAGLGPKEFPVCTKMNGVKTPTLVITKNHQDNVYRGLTNRAKEKTKFDGKIPKECFVENIDDVKPMLVEQQKSIDKMTQKFGKGGKLKADRILLVFDDQAGLFKSSPYNNPIANFAIKHRHYNASCLWVTQAYKAIPKTIRTNCDAAIVFEIGNNKELDVIYEEWPNYLSKDQWMDCYKEATKDDFSFLYMNNRLKKGQRMWKRFLHPIAPA